MGLLVKVTHTVAVFVNKVKNVKVVSVKMQPMLNLCFKLIHSKML